MNDEVLDRLKDGILKFQAGLYAEHAEEYRKAGSTPQQPHTLMISCADSRIDVESITSSKPGEMFTTRNVGNMVPSYGEMLGGVSAVIEYAVSALHVKHIVVCGHSDCGAMKALLHPESTNALPAVRNWLTNAAAALNVAGSSDAAGDSTKLLRRLTEENVLLQLAHLSTHPSVAGAMARRELTVSGWVYDIGTGQIDISEDGIRNFKSVGGIRTP